jgi:phenylpropionate dioxygenase-like ring-hydroxylating dioxygenase large terminal subunit
MPDSARNEPAARRADSRNPFPGFGDAIALAEPDDVLDPRHFADVRKQGGASHRALPLWCYTSERFFQAEMERMLLPGWLLLERAELAPAQGDFHCLDFMNIPLLMARGSDDKLRVFANTCRHRGALVATGSGNCKSFRCPYHAWTYALDGALLGAPAYVGNDDRDMIDASNKKDYGLIEIESGVWGGFVFVRFRPGPQTLGEHLGELPALFASHRLEDMVTTNRLVFEMDANWKCFVENYSDGYHIPTVHHDSLARWKTKYGPQPTPGPDCTATFAEHDGSQLLLPFPGYDGFPAMPQIDEDKKRGTWFMTLKPNMMMTMGNDGALVFNSEPLTATTSRLTVSSLFPKSTVARNDFGEIAKNYYRRNDIVVGEDVEISLRQAAGLMSPYAAMAPLCRTETSLNTIGNWILDRVIGPA